VLRTIIVRCLLAIALWWILSEGRIDSWGIGAITVVSTVIISLRFLPASTVPLSLAGLVAFICLFVWNSVRGGIQVALAAFEGRTALRPGILEMRLQLPPGGGRILLVNTLGLMPGTLGVELVDDRLRLHVLDERLPIAEEAREIERAIGRVFKVTQ